MNNKRIIKNEIINIPPKTQILHPISSRWIKNETKPICLTKFQLQNKETKTFNDYVCKTNPTNYSNYLYIPPIGLSSNDLLQVYNIDSVDRLNNWIKENIETLNYITLNRCVNSWIRVNYDTLKNYNNFLEKIVNKIVIKYNGNELKKVKNLDKEIKDYIDYWIGKNNGTEYNLNLINDFMAYIRKKYK